MSKKDLIVVKYHQNEVAKAEDLIFGERAPVTVAETILQNLLEATGATHIIVDGLLGSPATPESFNVVFSPGMSFDNNVNNVFLLASESTVAFTSPSAQDRIDLVEIRALEEDSETRQRSFIDGATGNVTLQNVDTRTVHTLEFQVIAGTPGSGNAPTQSVGWAKLAEVRVRAGSTGINSSDIRNADAARPGVTNTDWTTEIDTITVRLGNSIDNVIAIENLRVNLQNQITSAQTELTNLRSGAEHFTAISLRESSAQRAFQQRVNSTHTVSGWYTIAETDTIQAFEPMRATFSCRVEGNSRTGTISFNIEASGSASIKSIENTNISILGSSKATSAGGLLGITNVRLAKSDSVSGAGFKVQVQLDVNTSFNVSMVTQLSNNLGGSNVSSRGFFLVEPYLDNTPTLPDGATVATFLEAEDYVNTSLTSNTTRRGIVQLNNTITSTSTEQAATANAVRIVQENLDTRTDQNLTTTSSPIFSNITLNGNYVVFNNINENDTFNLLAPHVPVVGQRRVCGGPIFRPVATDMTVASYIERTSATQVRVIGAGMRIVGGALFRFTGGEVIDQGDTVSNVLNGSLLIGNFIIF